MFTELITYRASHKWTIGYSDEFVLAYMAKLRKGSARRLRKFLKG